MRLAHTLILAGVLLVFPTISQASDFKVIRCTFDQSGISASWANEFKSKKGKFSNNPADTVMTINEIDKEKNTAQLIGNGGSVQVHIIDSSQVLSFLEITPTGNQILTSIFVRSPQKDGTFPAVTSRHVTVISPIVSQYYGSCSISE